MPSTVELSPGQFREFLTTEVEGPKVPPPPASSTVLASPNDAGPRDHATRARQLRSPVPHRLATTGPEGATLELPMRADLAFQPDLWLETPETTKGFHLHLFVDRFKRHANLNVSAEYVGLPVETVLSYVRFLRSLYLDDGKLIFTVLGPERRDFDVAYLPLLRGEAAKAQLEATMGFVRDVVRIGEATGMSFVYPSELTGEDVLAARRASEIIRTGWVMETVTDLRLSPTPEGARTLPLDDEGVEITLALDGEGTVVRVAGREVNLGPSIHWIERVRMKTPPAQVREWLASDPDPDDRIEVRFVPVGGVPLHAFFPEWPKASPERLTSTLETFEKKTGKSSGEFASAWEKGEDWAREIEGGNVWMSLIRAREVSSQSETPEQE